MAIAKKAQVPLDEALTIAGTGRYTYFVMLASGMCGMSAMMVVQAMSFVIPVAGCELQLSDAARGIISSMPFMGMLFSAQLFGFLADTLGRKKVLLCCFSAMLFMVSLSSLAPDTISLAVSIFLQGFILTGIFTPVYVFVGEFSEPSFKAKGLIIMTSLTGVSFILMPSLAWIIMPLDIYIPIFDLIVFTSWRLYILLLLLPNLLSLLLLLKIPETPKFLLIQGRNEETLNVLKKIYAVNNNLPEEDFPVCSVILDEGDESSDLNGKGNKFFNYLKMMMTQIIILFSRKHISFTLISCILLFGSTGVGNSLFLWFPEMASRIKNYSHSQGNFNVGLCNLMGVQNIEKQGTCQIAYDFLSASILLGAIEVIVSQFLGFTIHKLNKKIFIVVSSFLAGGITFVVPFLSDEYAILVSIGAVIVIMCLKFSVILSIIVESFPTQLRSTATSITMTSARLGSAIGSQAMGLLFPNYCTTAFYGLTSLLVACGVLCLLLPTRKKSS